MSRRDNVLDTQRDLSDDYQKLWHELQYFWTVHHYRGTAHGGAYRVSEYRIQILDRTDMLHRFLSRLYIFHAA